MIEVHLTYTVRKGIDDQAYFQWMKKSIVPLLKSRGIIEVRAYRNNQQHDIVLVVATWEKQECWNEYSCSEDWTYFLEDLQNNFGENIQLEIWEPSQLIPKSIHPRK